MSVVENLRKRAIEQKESPILRLFHETPIRYEFEDHPRLLREQTFDPEDLARFTMAIKRSTLFRFRRSNDYSYIYYRSGAVEKRADPGTVQDEALLLTPEGRALWMRQEPGSDFPGVMTILGRCPEGRWEETTFGHLHYNGRPYEIKYGKRLSLAVKVYEREAADFLSSCRLLLFLERHRPGEFVADRPRTVAEASVGAESGGRAAADPSYVRIVRTPVTRSQPQGGHRRGSPVRPHNRRAYEKVLRSPRWKNKRGQRVSVRPARIHGGSAVEPLRVVRISLPSPEQEARGDETGGCGA